MALLLAALRTDTSLDQGDASKLEPNAPSICLNGLLANTGQHIGMKGYNPNTPPQPEVTPSGLETTTPVTCQLQSRSLDRFTGGVSASNLLNVGLVKMTKVEILKKRPK